jgi:hypothetical protein
MLPCDKSDCSSFVNGICACPGIIIENGKCLMYDGQESISRERR